MQPISLFDLQHATCGEWQGRDETSPLLGDAAMIERLVTDSRLVQPGDLFWALRGEHFDGHAFLSEAKERGARAAVVDGDATELSEPTLPRLKVINTLQALGELARWRRSHWQGNLIGITGSVGKTTTRAMLHSVLSVDAFGHQSPHNFNNDLGVPLTLLELHPDHRFAVVEMGARQPGDIRTLARLCSPKVGVITTIGSAHWEKFGSVENILAAKGELIVRLPADGVAILNGDEATTLQLRRMTTARVIQVGKHPRCDLRLERLCRTGDGWRFQVGRSSFQLAVTGKHFVMNALFAIAVAREFGMDDAAIAEGLLQFRAMPGRCRVRVIGPWTVIDDSYNASPASMAAAIETLGETVASRRILVLGEMCELGRIASAEHSRLGELIARQSFDEVFVCGQHAAEIRRAAIRNGVSESSMHIALNSEMLRTDVMQSVQPGDAILVKGSRATRMERVIESLEQRAEALNVATKSTPLAA